jgi:hypothetical protein
MKCLWSINENVYQGLPGEVQFTNDLDQIRSALLRTAPVGLTALYDAIAVGIDHLKAGTRDRKALIVLSDGGDNASHRTVEDVIQVAQRSSATIYTIGLYDDTNRDRNPAVLQNVARLSGGRAYFPDSVGDLEKVWRDIAGALRSQYTIGYRSSNPKRDGMFRNVKITASRSGGRALRVLLDPATLVRPTNKLRDGCARLSTCSPGLHSQQPFMCEVKLAFFNMALCSSTVFVAWFSLSDLRRRHGRVFRHLSAVSIVEVRTRTLERNSAKRRASGRRTQSH